MIAFVCHPYHRGGVTIWMKDAFLHCSRHDIPTAFLTIRPGRDFISGAGRPAMVDFIGSHPNVYAETAGVAFELGTPQYRVAVYRKLITSNVPEGAVLIPSDDEACWQACCSLASRYRVVGVLHSDDPLYYQHYRRYHPYLAGVVCVSNRILSKAGPHAIPACTIPCGIQTEQFMPGNKSNTIVWVGRLEEYQKRASDLIPVCVALQQQMPGWQVDVYGHGEQLPVLTKQKASMGLSNLTLHGWQPTSVIGAALSDASILLQTSEFEGMSVAVMEALAAGCVVVSSRVSGVEDLEQVPEAAGIVHTYATGQISEAVEALVRAAGNRAPDTVQRARTLAVKRFSIASCMEAYLSFTAPLAPASQSWPFRQRISDQWQSMALATLRLIKFKITKSFNVCAA